MLEIRTALLVFLIAGILSFIKCSEDFSRGPKNFNKYCGSCHAVPSTQDLPKSIWKDKVLPEMGARMGIYMNGYNPMKDMSWAERSIVTQRNYYPKEPLLPIKDWEALYDYVLNEAPDSLQPFTYLELDTTDLPFTEKYVDLDGKKGALITYIDYNEQLDKLIIGNGYGELSSWSEKDGRNTIIKTNTTAVAYKSTDQNDYLLEMGQMTPTELASGTIYTVENGVKKLIKSQLHRPVYLEVVDFDNDGTEDLLLSEFGHYSGQLSILKKSGTGYETTQILNLPGVMKTSTEDMDGDGRLDIVAMVAQGDEGMYIFYQQEDMSFVQRRILRFSSVYGSSWYDLIDFNGDGIKDIVTVHGDNADYSHTLKPYHGVRIFINEGQNNYTEKYFQSIPGATRVVARDFDQDGDVDMGITCFFSDFEHHPEGSFIYAENMKGDNLQFNYKTIPHSDSGRWLVAEALDYDQDGDDDIVLGSFTYALTPVPPSLMQKWQANSLDILILTNNLK